MSRLFLVSCLAIFLAAPLSAADTVTLNYGWVPGLYAEVDGYQTQQKSLDGQSQGNSRVDMSYVMTTQTHEVGIQVDYSEIKTSVHSDDSRMQGFMKGFMESVSGAMPSYLIGPDGEMSGVTNVPELRQEIINNLSELMKDAPEAQKQQIFASVGQLFSEENLMRQLEEEWNLYVGQWLGAELEDDGVYELEFDTPIPALGNQMVKSVAQYEFAGRVNCDNSDESQSCVRLFYRSETDSVSVTELLRKLVPQGQPIPDIDISVTLDMEIIADPDTLLPYYTKRVEQSASPVETPNGTVTATQVQSSELRYRYQNVQSSI